jgi:hypothetical protein
LRGIFLLSLLVQVGLIVHVVRTGRNMLWLWVILLLPAAGSLAYVLVEVLPDFFRSRTARRAQRGIARAIDPDRDLRLATAEVEVSGNVDARRRLAEQLLQRRQYAEAAATIEKGLNGIFEHDPTLLLGLARAQFGQGQFTAARETLDRLIQANPDFKSADGHLLYAQALQEEGSLEKAESEYRTLAGYYPGAEARVRYALLLKKLGKSAEARRELEELLASAELAPKHYRRAQNEWLERARRELG